MSQLEQIEQVEERLLQAMLAGDIGELDALLSDDLLAVGPDGQLLSKSDDLASHEAGIVQLTAMTPQHKTIKLLPGVAIVFVLMELKGVYQDQPFTGQYRYTRVWNDQCGNWQIVAAHISPVPG